MISCSIFKLATKSADLMSLSMAALICHLFTHTFPCSLIYFVGELSSLCLVLYKYLLHITISQSEIYLKNYFVEDIHCGAASAKPLGAQSTTFGGSGGIYSQQLLG